MCDENNTTFIKGCAKKKLFSKLLLVAEPEICTFTKSA